MFLKYFIKCRKYREWAVTVGVTRHLKYVDKGITLAFFFFNVSGSLSVVSDTLIMFVEGEDIKDDENFSSLWCESS